MKPTFITVSKLPEIKDTRNEQFFEIIDAAGLFWGRFKTCQNWIGERFFLSCDPQGRIY